MSQSFESWWKSLGPMTKFTLLLPLFLCLTGHLRLIHPKMFLLDWEAVWYNFEIWRPITALFYLGGPGLPFAFNLYFFVTYTKRLETESSPKGFLGRLADQIWMLVIIALALYVLGSYMFGMPVLSASLLMSILWVWCKRNPTVELSFYGFAFSAAVFPWVLTGIHMLMGGNLIEDILGVVAGHVYFFLKDVMPDTHGWRFAETPHFLLRAVPPTGFSTSEGGFHRFGHAGAADDPVAARPAHRWPGGGQRLGEQQQ